MASTPVTPGTTASKRMLSNSSTPSPSTNVVVKKAKLPEPESESSQPSTENPHCCNFSNDDIVSSVLLMVTEQLKSTISEQVNISVTAMAESVAEIVKSKLNDRLSTLECENKQLHEQLQQLTVRVGELELQQHHHQQSTTRSFDVSEQYSRRSCLRISGIPESSDEVTDDIVLSIAQECEVNLARTDIDRSHRVPARKSAPATKPRPADIIVKFISYRSRAALLGGKSRLKSSGNFKGVYINEDLTQYRASLLRSARLLVKSGKASSAWSRDGRIFIKNNDGSRVLIKSEEDIANLNQ